MKHRHYIGKPVIQVSTSVKATSCFDCSCRKGWLCYQSRSNGYDLANHVGTANAEQHGFHYLLTYGQGCAPHHNRC